MRARIGIGSVLALLTLLVVIVVVPSVAGPGENVVANGDFESGFGTDGVGQGWNEFQNGGEMTASWHDDTCFPWCMMAPIPS